MLQKENFFLLLFFSASILISTAAYCQMTQAQVDSMKKQLAKATEDTNKVNLLMNLANEAGYTDLNKALDYALQGYDLASRLTFEKGIGNMA